MWAFCVCITINDIGTCVDVFVFWVYFFLVIYEQQRDRSLVCVFASVCVREWFVYWWYRLLSVSVVFFLFLYLFRVSLITTQLKHQSSYSRTMFMYISASFILFVFLIRFMFCRTWACFESFQSSRCKLRCILLLLLLACLYRIGQSRISASCFIWIDSCCLVESD